MTALQEQAIRLIERMPDERLPRAIALLHDLGSDGRPAKDKEALACPRGAPSMEDDRRSRLIALFGSITDETFHEYPAPPFSLDAKKA